MTHGSTAGTTHGITEDTGADGTTLGHTGDTGAGTTLGTTEDTGGCIIIHGIRIMPDGTEDGILITDMDTVMAPE